VGAIVGDALAQRLSAPIGAFVFDAARNVQLASFGLLIGGTTAHYWCDPAPNSTMSLYYYCKHGKAAGLQT